MNTAASELADAQRRDRPATWWVGYLGVVGGGLFIAMIGRDRLDQPFLAMTLAFLALLVTAWFLRPTAALYATLFLSMIGDDVTTAWFPFNKYLSSEVSIAFVANGLSISPLEISLATGLTVTSLRHYSETGRLFHRNGLFRPVVVFGVFIIAGFARGLSRSGDPRIAILEGRGLLYLIAMFLIASIVLVDRRSMQRAIWWVIAGTVIHSVFALEYLSRIPSSEREGLESLVEHGASLPMNLVLILVLVSLMFRGVPTSLTVVFGALLVPVGTVYLISQRRAAVAALCVAIGVMCMVLAWRQPRTFWKAVPVLAIVTGGYVGAFWNSQSTAGFPAQAIKSVVAPGQAAEEDQGSDLYRIYENIDVNYTIRASPLLGIGFGQPFYRPIPLPAIADFTLARYVPHNSILWVWMKTGLFGFASMLYLMTKALMLGTRRARMARDGLDTLVPLVAVLYITMYTIYTYVDISWDARNTPLLGLALAVCAFEPDRDRGPNRSASSDELRRVDPPRRPAAASDPVDADREPDPSVMMEPLRAVARTNERH